MKKVENPDEIKIVVCNYWSKELKWSKFGGYNTYWRYVDSLHLTKAVWLKPIGQTKIKRYISLKTQLFRYSNVNNRE